MLAVPIELKITFILAMVVVLILLGFFFFIIYIYNKKQLLFQTEKELQEKKYENDILQKELERKNAIQKERERISHDMHDDLGAGISALRLQAEFLKQKVSQQPDLQKDIDDLLQTSSEMNISMREMLWSLNQKNDTVDNFVRYCSSYAHNFFAKSPISIDIKNEGINKSQDISSLIRRNLFLAVKEALNNIHKHSDATQAHLFFSLSDQILSIKISDDGNGIPEEFVSGTGLKSMSQRMDAISGEYELNSNDEGTQLLFSIALNNRDESQTA